MNDKLTRSDIAKMEEEINYRKLELKPQLIASVKEARAHGDLSENFEYHAAKREKNANESRIRYLERMIRTADVIDDTSKDDEVGMNSLVTVLFEEENEVEKYKIVTTIREDSVNGRISIESPLGKALLGHKIGDRLLIKVNDDYSYHVVIKDIDKSRDDSDDRIRSF